MRLRLPAVLTCVGAAAVALAPAAAAAGSAHTVTSRATRTSAGFAVTQTAPGWTMLRNTGSIPELILRGTGGDANDIASDYNHKRFAEVDRRFPVATSVDSSSAAYLLLKPGHYFAITGEHSGTWKASQIGELDVTGSRVDAALPTRSNTFIVARNGDLGVASTVSRLHWAKLVSHASHYVDVLAVTVDRSTSEQTIKNFLAHPSLKKISSLAERPVYTLAETSAQDSTIYNPEELRRGRQMVISFTSLKGKLHKGQAKLITVR